MTADKSNEQLTPLRKAVYLLKEAQSRLAAYEQARSEPIAVIGSDVDSRALKTQLRTGGC